MDGRDGAEIEFAVEMREQIAAAGWLPAQVVTECVCVHSDQKQAGLAEIVLPERLGSCAAVEKWMKPSRASSALPR